MLEAEQPSWYPIAASTDLPFRHTYQGQLLGQEFAVWRADDGHVNVWENRCLHRGVRLSIGINDGRELKCQYHGWRYANRTAECTYIPAHPADAPARTLCNRTFTAVERYGFIWSNGTPIGEMPEIKELENTTPFALRGIPINGSLDLVVTALRQYSFQPSEKVAKEGAQTNLVSSETGVCILVSNDGDAATTVLFFVHPLDSGRCVIRGVLNATPSEEQKLDVLKHHNQLLTLLRDRIEAEAALLPTPAPMIPIVFTISEDFTHLSEPDRSVTDSALRVQVAKKWQTAEGITGFKLVSTDGPLPTYQPGAHIDVHMPNGLTRQYSLTNGPGETDHYTIGVKLEMESQGGSKCMHEQVREDDVLAISKPHNNFPLRRDAIKTIFVAGGIGITPLLAMSRALHHSSLNYELHYFVQSKAHMAFSDVLESQKDTLVTYLGLTPDQTGNQLSAILKEHKLAQHLYICGPGPMLEVTRKIASDLGWPEAAIHFEYFKNTNEIDDSSSFKIDLARSAMTLQVPAGKSILDVLRENSIYMPSSCQQGACGTCRVNVLEGEPDHQDVFLNESEKQNGKSIMTCVSRAKSKRLVLDI